MHHPFQKGVVKPPARLRAMSQRKYTINPEA